MAKRSLKLYIASYRQRREDHFIYATACAYRMPMYIIARSLASARAVAKSSDPMWDVSSVEQVMNVLLAGGIQ